MSRILGIAGSMRHGNTEAAVAGVLAGAAEAGAATELLCLRDYRIEFCRGCYELHDLPARKCAIDDDMAQLLPRLSAADGIVFGSPAYFGGIAGLLRTFLDRTGLVHGRLDGKAAALVAVGEDRFGGQELVAQELSVFCRSHRLRVVGWPLCLQTPAGDKAGSLAGDAAAMAQAGDLGRLLVAELGEGIKPRKG